MFMAQWRTVVLIPNRPSCHLQLLPEYGILGKNKSGLSGSNLKGAPFSFLFGDGSLGTFGWVCSAI